MKCSRIGVALPSTYEAGAPTTENPGSATAGGILPGTFTLIGYQRPNNLYNLQILLNVAVSEVGAPYEKS